METGLPLHLRLKMFIESDETLNVPRFARKYNFKSDNVYKWQKGTKPSDANDLIKLESILGKVESKSTDKNLPSILDSNHSNAKAIADPPHTEILAIEGLIPLADGKFLMNTPLIPIKAYAGYITSWGDEEYISDLPVHPIIVDQAHRGEYKSFEVTGDSMDDGTKNSIEDRSIATGRRLDRSHWKNKFHLKKFSRFIIVSLDGILIKEIIDHDTKTGIITCHSLNPDKKQYPDFELSLDRVIQIFNVVQVTKKE